MFSSLFTRYSQLLIEHPIKTKAITCGVITAASDCITQHMLSRNLPSEHQHFSYIRSFKMFSYGLLALGPILHNWFRIVEYCLPFKANATPRQRVLNIIKRVALESITYNPFIITTFYTINTTMDYYLTDEKTPPFIVEQIAKGESLGEVLRHKIERDFVNSYAFGLQLWPAAQAVNYFCKFVQFRKYFDDFKYMG